MCRTYRNSGLVVVLLILLTITSISSAQTSAQGNPPNPEPTDQDASALAKQTQNPVGDIVSIPFQFNFSNGGDLQDATLFTLNFQPVIPVHLSEGWTLISRTIMPIASVPGPGTTRFSGIGDIQEQMFFTPAKAHKIILGIGPAFSFPTATAAPLQTGTWAAGGAFVLVANSGPFLMGTLVSQLSPLTDANGPPRTNLFLVQPFLNFNFGKGWALSTGPSITADWNATSDQRWTIPVGMGITRTLVFNKQPMSLGFSYYRSVERPVDQPANLLRFSWSLIFPTAHH